MNLNGRKNEEGLKNRLELLRLKGIIDNNYKPK